jgi:hypothetical protein
MAFDNNKLEEIVTTYTQALEAVTLDKAQNFVVQYSATVTTPTAATFTVETELIEEVETPTNNLLAEAHGMETGLKVQVSSGTTLPDGLSGSTDYFVIKIDADKFQLAASLADAQAGTEIDILDEGTGTHTVTPTALAGGVIKMQESVDGQIWYDISGVTANITATATALLKGSSNCGQVRAYLTMTAGQLSIGQNYNVK